MSWAEELDLMNRDCQEMFSRPVQVVRRTKGATDPDTGSATVISSNTRTVNAVVGEEQVVEFTGSGGRSQRVIEQTFEILVEDMEGPTNPQGPIRAGDAVIVPDLTIASDGNGDGASIEYTVRSAPTLIGNRFYRVVAHRSEVTS